MTVDVRVADDFMIDGVAIYVSIRDSTTSRRLLRIRDGGTQDWEIVEPAVATEPTLKLQGECARALLDALLRHYEGASDMHTVRSDLLHERGRVDRLITALIDRTVRGDTT